MRISCNRFELPPSLPTPFLETIAAQTRRTVSMHPSPLVPVASNAPAHVGATPLALLRHIMRSSTPTTLALI